MLVSGEVAEQRRRPLFRRAKPTTTSEPAITSDDSEGSETKGHQRSDPFSVITGGNQQAGSQAVASGSSFKADGDKLTSFSEYSFGSHGKLLPSGGGSLEDATSPDDEASGYAGFKNHKTASQLPTTNANNKGKPADRGAFDFLARDYAKAKGSFGAGGIQHDTAAGGLLGTKSSKTSSLSSVSSKFSISHPSPIGAAGKLAHLDDSTEYDVYASLGQSATGKTKLGASTSSSSSSSSLSPTHFDGKVKKVPFKYEDGGFGAASTTSLKGGLKTKSKLALDDDNDGGVYGGKQQQQQQPLHNHQQSLLATKSKFNFAEPPALVKSTLNTLKHFGDGLLGNGGNGALFHTPNPYDLDSDEGGGLAAAVAAGGSVLPASGLSGFHGGAGKFGASHHGYYPGAGGQLAVEESYEAVASGELGGGGIGSKPYHHQHPKSPLPSSPLSGVGKFATDFDVKNIKLTGDGGAVFGGHSTTKYHQHQHHHQGGGITPGKNTPPHHTTKQQQQQHLGHLGHSGQQQQLLLHQQQQQQLQQLHQHQQHAPHHAHAPTHATGAGIAAKGQIESFLNAEHGLKDSDSSQQQQQQSGGRPHYHTLQKSKEEEQLEKEALRQQIEYLKAQAAKRPVDLSPSNPARPAIVSNAQKFRPVRRIPPHVRLGVKAPYPLPRIPHYNDRPYSISFKI
ncbi:box A-binding factor-like [Anopheles aquasalis]|uniref:box A-binding factor-like n=1 Tax=Anopheles aquasalis TaxID=42839 RepID=UPI00215A5146|nr:box A-binding factor-like [Anopheles aquasalis]